MDYKEAEKIMEDVFEKAEFAYEKNAAGGIRVRGGYGFKTLEQDREKWREAYAKIKNG